MIAPGSALSKNNIHDEGVYSNLQACETPFSNERQMVGGLGVACPTALALGELWACSPDVVDPALRVRRRERVSMHVVRVVVALDEGVVPGLFDA